MPQVAFFTPPRYVRYASNIPICNPQASIPLLAVAEYSPLNWTCSNWIRLGPIAHTARYFFYIFLILKFLYQSAARAQIFARIPARTQNAPIPPLVCPEFVNLPDLQPSPARFTEFCKDSEKVLKTNDNIMLR